MDGSGDLNIEALYQRYFPIIRAKCARMLRDGQEGADVAQETFTRLWRDRHGIQSAAAVTAWIYRTSTRLAIDAMRRNRRLDDDAPVESMLPAPGHLEANVEARRLLERLALEVPTRELEMAVLHRLDGLTQQEIACVTGCSERTTRRVLASFDQRVQRLGKEKAA